MLLLMLILFWLQAPTTEKRLQTFCVCKDYILLKERYYRPGDLIIGVGFEFSQEERRVYPSFFRINPKESPQYVGLVQLLLYFQWNWVGLLAPESDDGEHFISIVMPMLKEKEICLAFTEMLKLDSIHIAMHKILSIFQRWFKIEVFILFGDSTLTSSVQLAVSLYEAIKRISFWNVCILTSHWYLSMVESKNLLQFIKPFHGALHLRDHTRDVPGFSHFLLSLDPLNPHGDVFLPRWW
ncbi:hypothetical protein E2320_022132, partial [Naja naja]